MKPNLEELGQVPQLLNIVGETEPVEVKYLDAYAPNETIPTLLDLDIEQHVQAGRTNLVLDAESTFVKYDGWRIEEKYSRWFERVRERGITRVIITTNKQPKDTDDLVQMQAWAEQTGADLLISPMDKSQRKPSPYMLFAAMQHFDLDPDSIVSVGDKLTSDVLSANLAKVHSVHVRNRLGNSDHLGDRIIKRPFEKHILARLVEGRKPRVYEQTDRQVGVATIKYNEMQVDEYITAKGLLSGYGIDPIILEDRYLSLLPAPQFASLRNTVEEVQKRLLGFKAVERYMHYIEVNGEDHAEALTKFRKNVLAPMIGTLAISAGLLARTRYKKTAAFLKTATIVAYAGSHVTDGLDGFSIRRSGVDLNTQRRIDGAEEDRLADQEVSEKTGWGSVIGLLKDPVNQYVQSLRIKLRRKQTKKWTEAGYDTKSDKYSKFANEFQGIAEFLSLKSGFSKMAIISQTLATLIKLDSMFYSESVWKYRKAREEAAEQVLEELKNG